LLGLCRTVDGTCVCSDQLRQLQHRAARRHLNGSDTSTEEHHEPATMAGAKEARFLGERFDQSLDDLTLVDRIVLIPDVELITTHEPDP
jgi:hypothetical protein